METRDKEELALPDSIKYVAARNMESLKWWQENEDLRR
jgi:hypothetical protein